METTITITYQHVGTTPPLFVAGTFTQPAWVPQELDYSQAIQDDDDDKKPGLVFHKTFTLAPGTYQYKFRVGYGDWWICDETKATSEFLLRHVGSKCSPTSADTSTQRYSS